MEFYYSVYLNLSNKNKEEKLTKLLQDNNLEIEKNEIFNADFAIVEESLSYPFPHIVMKKDLTDFNFEIFIKNDGIDIILEEYPEDYIQLKIQNAIYFVMARGSRGTYKQRVAKELDTIKRTGGKFSVGMISIMDYYKLKNNLNTLSLDEVTKEINKMIDLSIRKTDEVMKLSRREFGIIFPNTELRSAEIACQRIKRRSTKMNPENRMIKLACGITEISDSVENSDEIIETVKKSLYMSEGNNGEVTFI